MAEPELKLMGGGEKRKEFVDDIRALIAHYQDDMSDLEMLALIAHMLGSLIAFQDYSKFTKPQVMQLVIKNMQQGNTDAMKSVLSVMG